MKLTEKEKTILWAILNNAQHQKLEKAEHRVRFFDVSPAMFNVLKEETKMKMKEESQKFLDETHEEYDLCERLKAELCSDKSENTFIIRAGDDKRAKEFEVFYKGKKISNAVVAVELIGDLPQ